MLIKNVVNAANIKLATAVCLVMVLSACGGGGGSGGGGDSIAKAINDAGNYTVDESTLGRSEVPVVVPGTQQPVLNEVSINNTDWLCSEKTVSVEEAPQEFVLFADSSFQGIYPGAMLQGNTLDQDPPSPVRVARGGGTVIMPIFTGEPGVNSVTVNEVTSGSITDAINTMVAGRTLTPASFSYKATRVESSEDLRIAMGMQTGAFSKVTINTSFESSGAKEHWVIKMVQPFYSVQYEVSNDWFAAGVTAADLSSEIYEGNPPVYVSSITYGRIVYLVVTTSSSKTEASASMDVSSGVTDFSASIDRLTSLTNTSVEALVYGGGFDEASSLLTGDLAAARAALTVAPNFALAKPIAYTMADVKNGQNVKVKLGDSFTVRDCYPSVGVRLNYAARQDLGINSITDVETGDFNNDQKGDLLLASISPGQNSPWRIAISNGDGSYQLSDQSDMPVGLGTNSIHVADLNGDSYDDVVLQNQELAGMGTITKFPNTAGADANLFDAPESGIYCNGYTIFGNYQMYVGHFVGAQDSLLWNVRVDSGNGDGMYVINVTNDQMWGACGNGMQGVTSTRYQLSSFAFTDSIPLLVGDVGGDGLDDLFVGTVLSDGKAYIWRTVSTSDIITGPSFLRIQNGYQTGRSNGTWEQGVGDVNDDGRSDFVLVDSAPDAASVSVLVYSLISMVPLVRKPFCYTRKMSPIPSTR